MGIGNIWPDADAGQNRARLGMALLSGASGQVSVFAPMARWLEATRPEPGKIRPCPRRGARFAGPADRRTAIRRSGPCLTGAFRKKNVDP